MKKITLDFYSDSRHGWAKVPLTVIKNLGIADKISSYSYIRNSHAYLEEDCDFTVLRNALRDRAVVVTIKEHHTDKSSKIRSYGSYNHNVIDWGLL